MGWRLVSNGTERQHGTVVYFCFTLLCHHAFFYTRSDLTGHDFQFIGGSWVIDHMFLLDILYSSLFGAHLQGINGTVYPRHSPAKRYDRF
jgi:hypothetical protein